MHNERLPIIDIARLVDGSDPQSVAKEIGAACRDKGFFYVVAHGVDPQLEAELERLSQVFFALPEPQKLAIRMERAGRAWRGFFPLGGELTSGKPDWKEGLYFGEEHSDQHPLVQQRMPLHGKNLFPELPGFRDAVLAYMQAMCGLGQKLMEAVALSLGLPQDYFFRNYTREPTQLFRIFHYPPPTEAQKGLWGVGEHTDYGLLTILKQDLVGGLQVKSQTSWMEAPPIPGSFVCNIGDMLDRLTGGYYCSTPHRVQNRSQKNRYSYPYFFDPDFRADITALPIQLPKGPKADRWDHADVHAFQGKYGDYLLAKVGKVFPDLK